MRIDKFRTPRTHGNDRPSPLEIPNLSQRGRFERSRVLLVAGPCADELANQPLPRVPGVPVRSQVL